MSAEDFPFWKKTNEQNDRRSPRRRDGRRTGGTLPGARRPAFIAAPPPPPGFCRRHFNPDLICATVRLTFVARRVSPATAAAEHPSCYIAADDANTSADITRVINLMGSVFRPSIRPVRPADATARRRTCAFVAAQPLSSNVPLRRCSARPVFPVRTRPSTTLNPEPLAENTRPARRQSARRGNDIMHGQNTNRFRFEKHLPLSWCRTYVRYRQYL